jgi:excinuclease UvrABC ATPase subunit
MPGLKLYGLHPVNTDRRCQVSFATMVMLGRGIVRDEAGGDASMMTWKRLAAEGQVIGEPMSAWEICARLSSLTAGTKFSLLVPLGKSWRGWRGGYASAIEGARREGYTQGRINGEMVELGKVKPEDLKGQKIEVIVDRLCVPACESEGYEEFVMRLAGSVRAALSMGEGTLIVEMDGMQEEVLREKRACACAAA